jgi:hypothetical protein
MIRTSISESPIKISNWLNKRGRWAVVLLVATFTYVIPASAQSADTWKSIAIIGGSTAAGAYIGHKVAGTTGAYVGGAVGAAAGYAIDRHRRQNENYNSDYPYDGSGYYGDNAPYPSNVYPDSGNGGYYPDSNGGYYPPDDQGSYYNHRQNYRRR